MDLLRVENGQIVTVSGQPLQLRGFNIGGWLNLEDFINGFPGAEHNLRDTMQTILGPGKTRYFFDRLLDYFFTEDDIQYIKGLGANVLRIPFNYRHFERDDSPFEYLEEGFLRLDQAVRWCEKHGIYIILDFHAAQGWQNPDWHSDNANVHILLYKHRHFQDRYVALWEEIVRRYKGNPVIAGYDLMNEPCTRLEYEQYDPAYYDWDCLNSLYRRVAVAIRKIDHDHIIIVEGDNFSTEYNGLDVSFTPNLVISTHNYSEPTIGPGSYPGLIRSLPWNRDTIAAEFGIHSGTRLAFKHHLPIFIGEFGVWYAGNPAEIAYRIVALDDQIGVFESAGVHWTVWTFKDIGAMGAINLNPRAEYLQLIEPILKAKHQVADWEGEMPASEVAQKVIDLADTVDASLNKLGLLFPIERKRFAQFTQFGYLAQFRRCHTLTSSKT